MPDYPIRVYETNTLSGRPFAILNDLRQALNHQDQGSGADILARAIAILPSDIAAMMLLPVHDELVFEVAVSEIEMVRMTIEKSMVQAAEEVLGGHVPAEVETVVGPTWTKG
ncbi:MAG: DNA polymerase [Acidobacteriaceae bacterium]